MRRILFLSIFLTFCLGLISCEDPAGQSGNNAVEQPPVDENAARIELAKTNLVRSMQMINAAKKAYFSDNGLAMSRFYNPFTAQKSHEKGSVWMYTSAIEAVNALLHGFVELKEQGEDALYRTQYQTYSQFLSDLVDNLEYYAGTYTLTSYTQTKEWTIYGVNRSGSKGYATVEGIANVYDDQQWLIRELIESYRITGEKKYLEKAEYLAEYVLDGWDTTLDEKGIEHGGIVWGPGYYTKHSCSNGPFVSPLVWLSDIYKDSDAQIEYRYIDTDKSRKSRMMNRSEYYLMYAEKVYDFQKSHLLRKTDGVYYDMLGAKGFNGDNIAYETVDAVRYRAHNEEQGPLGEAYSYNSGTMLSGAAELFGATGEQKYMDDMKLLAVNAFRYFAKKSSKNPELYEYKRYPSADATDFSIWFDNVLMRGWADVAVHYPNVDVQLKSFQNNLDFAYSKYLKNDFLPHSLHHGWNPDQANNKVEAMFTFAYAAEYAVLDKYYLNK